MKHYTIVDETKKTRDQHANNQAGAQGASFAGFNGYTGADPANEPDSSKSDSVISKRASVWLLNGKTITRHSIRTGLEDGTQVQVLSGLTTSDVVVDGVQPAGTEASQNNNNVRSPFMPPRRGNTRQNQGSGSRPRQ
jgi:hypothetical protein